ncbi:MAG: hypothetical protein LAN59_06630 [Acidobacteriia bacterium]|nr:hypothetical protein [Terriglobia bacterium]
MATSAGTAGAVAQKAASGAAGGDARSRAAQCDRSCLEAMTDRYMDALAAHDPSRAPLSPNVKYAQDNVPLKIGQALWATASGLGAYKHYFADPERGDVGLIRVVYENGVGAILILRLKVENRLITEAEQFVAHDPHGAAAYEKLGKPDPGWLTTIPADRRQSREALEQTAYMYYEALEKNDGRGIYAFTDDCNRIEDAVRTTNQPRPQNYGHSDTDISDFTTLGCKAQYELGFLGFTTGCRHRRFLVVDAERGAVLASAYLDFDGTVTEVHFTDGRVWKVPPYFMVPRTNQSNEAYRIENGSIRLIEMTMYEVPFNAEPAFDK